MPKRLLDNWARFANTVGIGPERNDIMSAQICALIVNTSQLKKRDVSPQEFMPYYDRFEEDITAEELVAGLHAALGR